MQSIDRVATTAVIVLIAFAGTESAVAGSVTTNVEGKFNNSQENNCLHLSKFFYLSDCSYSRLTEELVGNPLPWVGPVSNAVYFEIDSELADPLYVPSAGDARHAPLMTGTVTIDDQSSGDPEDDLISATLIVGPAARSLITNIPEIRSVQGGDVNAQPRAVHSWKNITHTVAPTAVDSATPNAHGGFDYVIASRGFPSQICLADHPDDCFPAEHAQKIETGQNAQGDWQTPGSASIARGEALGGNIGAQSTAVVEGQACRDNVGGDSCLKGQTVWGSDKQDYGLDNLLLKVVTDASGQVVTLEGYWTKEIRLDAGPPIFQPPEPQVNSWTAGRMTARRAE